MSRREGAAATHCVVAYATRARQYLWHLELPAGATVADALQAARQVAHSEAAAIEPEIWDSAPVGVYGEPRERTARCEEGDRIELYRPLRRDPRVRRRERVQHERRARQARGGQVKRG